MNWLFKQDGLNIDRKVANENMNEAKHKFDLGALNLRIQTRQQKPDDMNMNYKPRVIENIQLGRNIRTGIPNMQHIHKTHLNIKEMNKETNMFGFDMHQRRVRNKTFQSYNGVTSNMMGIPKSVDKFMSSGQLRTYEGRMAGREDINGKVKTNQEILLENWRKDPKFQAILATKGKSAPTPPIPAPAPQPPIPPSTNTSPNVSAKTSPNTSTKAIVNIVSPLVSSTNSNDDSKKKTINNKSSFVTTESLEKAEAQAEAKNTMQEQKEAFNKEVKGFKTPKQQSQKAHVVSEEKTPDRVKQSGMSLEDEIINEMGDIYEDSENEEDKPTKKDKIDVSNMTEADVDKIMVNNKRTETDKKAVLQFLSKSQKFLPEDQRNVLNNILQVTDKGNVDGFLLEEAKVHFKIDKNPSGTPKKGISEKQSVEKRTVVNIILGKLVDTFKSRGRPLTAKADEVEEAEEVDEDEPLHPNVTERKKPSGGKVLRDPYNAKDFTKLGP